MMASMPSWLALPSHTVPARWMGRCSRVDHYDRMPVINGTTPEAMVVVVEEEESARLIGARKWLALPTYQERGARPH